nr:mammalian ependymin-related protein 1 isoform X1 [Mirounga angustirostris]
MSGRARLGVAREALGAWLLGGLCFWALGGLCGLGAAAPGARAGGAPGTPRPCQAPQQWEGRQVLYRQSSGRNSRALLSYDGLNERVRVLDERKALIPCKRSQLTISSEGPSVTLPTSHSPSHLLFSSGHDPWVTSSGQFICLVFIVCLASLSDRILLI